MARPTVTNLLRPFESRPELEVVETLAASDQFLFERIVSYGHVTPAGKWLEQPRDEWVVLMSGAARLRFKESGETIELLPGDALQIPARCRHRVDWTRPDIETVWLALHFERADEEPPRN